jgi:hypothetical protein
VRFLPDHITNGNGVSMSVAPTSPPSSTAYKRVAMEKKNVLFSLFHRRHESSHLLPLNAG